MVLWLVIGIVLCTQLNGYRQRGEYGPCENPRQFAGFHILLLWQLVMARAEVGWEVAGP
jgi:hypothetical protein